MVNYNYIYGTLIDGREIVLDGFRIEAYETYTDDNQNNCIHIYFKSGQDVTMYFDWEPDGLDCDIMADIIKCSTADKEIVNQSFPQRTITCHLQHDKELTFDGNSVEFYIYNSGEEEEPIEIHFYSGRSITIPNSWGEYIEGENCYEELVIEFLPDCICRYLPKDGETPDKGE